MRLSGRPDPDTEQGSRSSLIGYLDAIVRRWRFLDGLTRLLWATTVLSAVALFGALGRITGLVSTRVALAPLLIAAPILLVWVVQIVVRTRTRASAAAIVDQVLDERDRFKTACELLDSSRERGREGPVDWTPYVLSLAAERAQQDSATPSEVLPLPEPGLVRAAVGTLLVCGLVWGALGYFGAPELRLPLHLVELPGAPESEDTSAAISAGEGVRAAEAPVPLTEEQLRKLLERAHRDSGLRDDGEGEPFDGELSEIGNEGPESSGTEGEGEAQAPDTELLEEVRRDLKEALDAQRGEEMQEGEDSQAGQEGAEGEQSATADGEADPDAQQVQDDSMAPGDQEQATMESSGQSSEKGDSTAMTEAQMAAAAAPSEGAEGEREGQSMGEGTGPQEGEAELYGDLPFQPLSTAIELQSALIEDQAQDFTTREREEKELPSRAQKAKRQYRRVTIPSRSENENFVDTRPVPWQYRELVQRVFTPEEETQGDDQRN